MLKSTASRTAALLAVAAGLGACSNMNNAEVNPRTQAVVKLSSAAGGTPQPNPQSPVQGELRFSELRGITSVNGTITGLKPNAPHAFHVHEKGDCSTPDFSSAGGHFNPTNQPHGAHGSGLHHLGDMPQLMADANGTAQVSFNSQTLKLRGVNTIIGKSVIVHRDADDVSHQPVGNAGPRLACGVIALQPAS
ncbi:MAG: superoxide dismutase family protein [Pseudomonadota bacterium]|nr:superoxide dismutase family protein [Pseudomonadota bacterium]